jgi:hypothetical protein
MIATGGLIWITSAVMRLGQWAKAGCTVYMEPVVFKGGLL